MIAQGYIFFSNRTKAGISHFVKMSSVIYLAAKIATRDFMIAYQIE
jgi:hypothetical protein